jgi:phosphatidylglycerophosphatase A
MKRLLTSCFGLGWLPLAPGTWGSLPPAVIFALMCHFGVAAVPIAITMAVLAVAGSVICIAFAPSVIKATGKSDPREVVADEFAGQAVTFLAFPFLMPADIATRQILIITALGFVLFRIFDVVKPWPIRKLEKLPKGWGILADDILAAVFVAILILLCLKIWLSGAYTLNVG